MSIDLLARADGLRARRVPFVLATVVRAERPTSARPGDRAIVLADGTIEGFVGGACAATTLRAQSAALLAAESAGTTLLRIAPGPGSGPAAPGTVVGRVGPPGSITVDNPCLSGGTLEIFLEAVMPSTLVHVFGETPIARALEAVGQVAGYEIRRTADPAGPIPSDTAAVVVASHGHDEQPVLRAALAAKVPYVGLVASPKRGAAVLAELGSPQAVKTPAGLDIGARTPGEVAVSILAELISRRLAAPSTAPPQTALDPVCGMTVTVSPASLSHEHAGRTWYFCAAGCRAAFIAEPARFGAAREPDQERGGG